jgi:hypothetical protein
MASRRRYQAWMRDECLDPLGLSARNTRGAEGHLLVIVRGDGLALNVEFQWGKFELTNKVRKVPGRLLQGAVQDS